MQLAQVVRSIQQYIRARIGNALKASSCMVIDYRQLEHIVTHTETL